jgi:hypothetical protein
MPLNTQIMRDGKNLPVRWGGFHVGAMVLAASWDSGTGPFEDNSPPTDIDYPTEPCPLSFRDAFSLMSYPVIATTPLNKGEYTLTGTHRFIDTSDGELFELLPGDILRAWRD